MLISEEQKRTREVGESLSRRQSRSGRSVAQRLQDLDSCWSRLQDKALQRRARLGQAQQVQRYFCQWTELMYVLRTTICQQ